MEYSFPLAHSYTSTGIGVLGMFVSLFPILTVTVDLYKVQHSFSGMHIHLVKPFRSILTTF